MLETKTATVTDKLTRVETATRTETRTDKVTVTEVSTKVQPTTFTSVWVKTDVIDKVSAKGLHYVSLLTTLLRPRRLKTH